MIGIVLVFTFLSSYSLGQTLEVPGTVDLSWGGTTPLLQTSLQGFDKIVSLVVTDDFNVVVVATTTKRFLGIGAPLNYVTLVKYSADGVLNTTFGTDGYANIYYPNEIFWSFFPSSASLYPGGRILVVGSAVRSNYPNSTSFYWGAALDQVSGAMSATFGDSGHLLVPSPFGGSIAKAAFSASGSLWIGVGGQNITAPLGTQRIMSMKVRTNGTLDDTYGVDGLSYSLPSSSSDVAIMEVACAFSFSATRTLLVGTRQRSGRNATVFVTIMDDTGQLTEMMLYQFPDVRTPSESGANYTAISSLPSSVASSCARMPDGGILVAGQAPGRFVGVLRLRPGQVALDTSYGVGGYQTFRNFTVGVTNTFPLRVGVMPSSQAILAFTTEPVPYSVSSARLSPSGNLDPLWSLSTVAPPSSGVQFDIGLFPSLYDLTIQRNGRVIVGGQTLLPASYGITYRLLQGIGLPQTCDIGPQCFCQGGVCMTQSDYVAPVNATLVNNSATINGNLIGNTPASVVYISPQPYGAGYITVSGVAYINGGVLVVRVNQSGVYPVLTALGGLDGQFGNIVVDPSNLRECEEGITSVVSSGSSSMSVLVTIRRRSPCLTTGETVGVVFAVLAVAGLVAGGIILYKVWKTRRDTETANANLRQQEMLRPNPQFGNDGL